MTCSPANTGLSRYAPPSLLSLSGMSPAADHDDRRRREAANCEIIRPAALPRRADVVTGNARERRSVGTANPERGERASKMRSLPPRRPHEARNPRPADPGRRCRRRQPGVVLSHRVVSRQRRRRARRAARASAVQPHRRDGIRRRDAGSGQRRSGQGRSGRQARAPGAHRGRATARSRSPTTNPAAGGPISSVAACARRA